jgi:hypothetical protein
MKKLFFRLSSGDSYSHDVSSFIGVKFLSSPSTCLAQFLFNSDDDTEIYNYSFLIEVGKELEFMREVQDNLSFSKKDSVVIFDDVDEYCVSGYADLENGSLSRLIIESPSILNGNLITNLSTDFNVTAGDITAVANLISTNDAQIDGNTDIGGVLDVTGNVLFSSSIVDSSTPAPTALSSGSSIMTVDGKDSVGKVTFTSAAGADTDVITVTYGTASTNTRVPVVTPISIDVTFTGYDNNGFTLRVGSTGVPIGGAFTYITQDYA